MHLSESFYYEQTFGVFLKREIAEHDPRNLTVVRLFSQCKTPENSLGKVTRIVNNKMELKHIKSTDNVPLNPGLRTTSNVAILAPFDPRFDPFV